MNVFNFDFICRKKCFHSLINANIKRITAVVPELSTLNTHGVAVAGHVKFENWCNQTLSTNWPEIPCIFIKTDNPTKIKYIYEFIKPSLTYIKWHFTGKCFVHLHSAVKWSNRNMSKIYSLSVDKRGEPELSWLFHIKIQLIHQNVKIQVQNV